MKTSVLFWGLLAGICFYLLPGCDKEEAFIPGPTDIETTIRAEGVWVIVDATITGAEPDKIQECSLEWRAGIDSKKQFRIGDDTHFVTAEKGNSLTYSFRIFPWSYFVGEGYNADKCTISATPLIRTYGKQVKGIKIYEEVRNSASVSLSYDKEAINKHDIRFNGKFNRTDRLQVEECGIYWAEKKGESLEDYTKCVSPEASIDFSVIVKDVLDLEKIYIFGYVKTPHGTIYSPVNTQYIWESTKYVTIDSQVKDLTSEQFTVSGEGFVKNPSLYPITERGFCYVKYANGQPPTITTNKIKAGTSRDSFTRTITGLEPATEYEVRAYIIIKGEVTYSNSIFVKTLAK